jgi:hypothetical protein
VKARPDCSILILSKRETAETKNYKKRKIAKNSGEKK